MMLKRSFDIVFSCLVMLLFIPVGITILVILFIFQGRPLFYEQERIGKAGKTFLIYKFRSMKIDSEVDGIPQLAQKNDNRETRIGRILRKHHLDELPQLWNVLKGDMSFVGPRPERQFYIDQIMACNPRYAELYQVRPGLTSYATLYNGYTDSMDKMLTRLDMDLYYLENCSVLSDIKIILLTAKRVIIGE